MTEHDMNIEPSQLNDAARLRAFADGELTADQVGDASSQRDRLAFESALRESVGRVMGGESVRAPEALRQSVAQMFRDEAPVAGSARSEPAIVTTPMGDTTDRSFWSGIARYGAIAAVLALVATLLIVGNQSVAPSGGVTSPFSVDRASNVQQFVPKAHRYPDTCTKEQFEAKFVSDTIDEAVEFAVEHLEGVPADLALKMERFVNSGFTFVGMGACAVPGDGNSVHAYFQPEGGGEHVSIFVQVESDEVLSGMCEMHCYGHDCPEDPGEKANLLVWKSGGYLHYLYSPDSEVAHEARAAFSVPGLNASLMPEADETP